MRVKLSRKFVKRQEALPNGFEGSGLKMAGSDSQTKQPQQPQEPQQAGGLQFDEDADDVINMPESESRMHNTDHADSISDPPDSDQPQIDQHQHGNENHNEYSSALAPSLTIGIVAIIIIAAVVVRYMRRKKRLEMLGEEQNKQSEKEKQLADNESYAQSSFNDGDYDTTPPPVYTILPRSSSLHTHSTFGNDQFGTINSVNTMQDLPPTPAPQDNDEESMHGLEPPRRPYVQSPPNAHFAPIMPRSSSLNSVNINTPMPRSSSLGSVKSAGERAASPSERVASPFSHSSSHTSIPMRSITPVQTATPSMTPSPSYIVSPPASHSKPSSPASASFVKTPPLYALSPPPG